MKISRERGFPSELTLDEHVQDPDASFERVRDKLFPFWNPGARVYHRPPTRVFLVEEIDGKWLYWGHAHVVQQTMKEDRTEGLFKIVMLYSPEYQELATYYESPEGKSFFGKG